MAFAPHTTDSFYAPLRRLARTYGLAVHPDSVGLRAPADVPVDQARTAIRFLRDAATLLGYRVHGSLADEPAATQEHARHRDAVARLEERNGDLGEFARAMATHLPRTWTVDLPVMDTVVRRMDITDRFWDEAHLAWIAGDAIVDRAAVLATASTTQLVIVDRPYGRRPFMVGALRPGTERLPDHQPPHAISVPANPERAAERVIRRLLPAYRRAVAATTRPPRRPATAAAPTPTTPTGRTR